MIYRLFPIAILALATTLILPGVSPLLAQEPTKPEATQGPTDKDAPKEFTKTPDGLKYRILRKSDGKKPTAKDTVTCHYRGWLDSGKEFDSSYKRGEPASFPLGGVIKGWTLGVPLIGEGGMIELEIPGDLGYGPGGNPRAGIAPDATLHFIIELVKIK